MYLYTATTHLVPKAATQHGNDQEPEEVSIGLNPSQPISPRHGQPMGETG